MKIYKKIGLLAVICLLAMTLVPTTNAATAPTTPPSLAVAWAGAESVYLTFNQTASNLTYIEYVRYTVPDDTQWPIGSGTVCFNASTGTSYTLEGLTPDNTYYFQAWNKCDAAHATPSATNVSVNIRLPPASASGGSTNPPMTPPAIDDTTTPPLTIGDDIEIPGFEVLSLIAAIGICFLITTKRSKR